MGSIARELKVNGPTVRPAKLAHVVLRTNNFEKQVQFYLDFLGARIQHKDGFLAFLTYDDEHHRIAIANMPCGDKVRNSNGLEHIAFTYNSLEELLTAYKQRAARNQFPVWCVNHAVTLSMYYKDCDGNLLESQIDLCDDEEANAIMKHPDFHKNPFGVDFDPEEMARSYEAGVPEAELLARKDIGDRTMESIPAAYMN